METFMTVFLSTSVIIWGILCLIWDKSNFFNFMIKVILFGMWVTSTILLLNQLGFIVKG